MYKRENLGSKSKELTNLKFLGRPFVDRGIFHKNQQPVYKC